MRINLFIIVLVIAGCANQKGTKSEKPFKNESQVSTHSKYRQECALTSKKFKDNLPSAFVEVPCADDRREDFGKVGADVIHAIAVAVFYEKRMDRRISAMNLIEKYECKTKADCEDFLYLIDWGNKSGHPGRYSKELGHRAIS
jgi:hypothetical protein